MTDKYLELAKKAIETYVKTSKVINPPSNLPSEMILRSAGVFVSIHEKDGSLRGCIGTLKSNKANIAQEIITNAIAAATQDPRFLPITPEELPTLVYSVDILSASKTISNYKLIDPKINGLIVADANGRRKGVLLPNLPGINTPERQIEICCQKAGIAPDEPVSLQIFTVERHK